MVIQKISSTSTVRIHLLLTIVNTVSFSVIDALARCTTPRKPFDRYERNGFARFPLSRPIRSPRLSPTESFSNECLHFRSYFQSLIKNDEHNLGVIKLSLLHWDNIFLIIIMQKFLKNVYKKAAICSVLTAAQ